ncbi:hypothetical protein P691DRAFT_717461 [Macrolepiota fuliginosa MF-IS2]|uniref:Rhodopsin domain-containing protein n=1 Tax=Macrolepiota fuliginosa MF-IS2 TaxID=1400762 RepID=A0A9P5XPM0_9AGAR|nr:hypothetical protein P691DRAFT_717461 [Macrolepiota fuliginosa MF-IS2]
MLSPLVQLRVACGVCAGVAVGTTAFRLLVRFRKNRLWIDDILAAFSMCALTTQLVAIFLTPNQRNGVARYYLIATMFYAAIWSARLSIMFAVIRIARTLQPTRFLYFIAALFLLTWIILTVQVFWECEPNPSWKRMKMPQCTLSRGVPIIQIVTDVLSDSSLLVVTSRLFLIFQEKKLRWRLTVIFGTCIITTVVSFVHAAYLIEAKGITILTAAVVEDSTSLIVCNIPVIVTAIIKLRKQDTLPSSPDDLPNFCVPGTPVSETRPISATLIISGSGSHKYSP